MNINNNQISPRIPLETFTHVARLATHRDDILTIRQVLPRANRQSIDATLNGFDENTMRTGNPQETQALINNNTVPNNIIMTGLDNPVAHVVMNIIQSNRNFNIPDAKATELIQHRDVNVTLALVESNRPLSQANLSLLVNHDNTNVKATLLRTRSRQLTEAQQRALTNDPNVAFNFVQNVARQL